MSKYRRIVSLPGGGVRGIISVIWLKRLVESNYIKEEDFDNIIWSGTSTGFLIAAALCKPNPLSLSEVEEMFKDVSKYVFGNTILPTAINTLIFGAAYDTKKLERAVEGVLGNVKVGDCQRKFVSTIYSLDERHDNHRCAMPIFVNNFKNKFNEHMLDYKLSDVAIGSASASTYFYAHRFKHNEDWKKWVDGGLCDNHASLGAVSTLNNKYNEDGCSIKDMAMLSIGNGGNHWYDEADKPANLWRTPRIASTIVNSIVQSGATLSEKAVKSLLGSRYYNINYSTPRDIDLADYKSIDFMVKFANEQKLNHAATWLQGYFS